MRWAKNNRLFGKLKNNSGIIIVVVMWVMVILSTLAISLSRKTNIELSLTKYALAKQKTKYFAWAGLMQGVRMIQLDSQDSESAQYDNLYYCGIPKKSNFTSDDVFKEKAFGDGYFSVQYPWQSIGVSAQSGTTIGQTYKKNVSGVVNQTITGGADNYSASEKMVYAMSDEERKINLNAIIMQNGTILEALLTMFDVEGDEAKIITASLIDWIDEDDVVTEEPYGAENEHYESLELPYKTKNKPLDSLAEFLLVRGMNKEILDRIRPFVTVFPKETELKVNFDTASETVLKAMARAFAGSATNTDPSDADSLVSKIIEYRSGDDRTEFTSDDVSVDIGVMPSNAKEKVLGLVINQYRTKVSDYLRISVVGVDPGREVSSQIEAVIKRDDLSIVYWKRK